MDILEHRGPGYRFGIFEVSTESRELFRNGHRIKIQDQPFQLLVLLLQNSGEIVDRDVIRRQLWTDDTFVDFGKSLGTAVTKLRQAIGDDANNPRFIETIPRRGYRFIAPVSRLGVLESRKDVEQVVAQLPSASADGTIPIASTIPAIKRLTPRWLLIGAATLLLAGLVAFYSYREQTTFAIGVRDTIVLADFDNTTGETIFNETLRQGLIVGLVQSPLIYILPDRTEDVILRQMGKQPDERVTGRTAIEICKRVGGKATIQGSISSMGTSYLVGLAAIRCDTAKLVSHVEVEAPGKDDVIDALGRAISQLRARFGESLSSVAKYNAPLEQATTSSLEALNAYGMALSTWDAKGDAASIPFFQNAIESDPNFAMAYSGLAAIYNNLGKADLATENTIKAYKLRDRVTEAERASIDARYFLYVTQEFDKATETYENLARDYPQSAGSYNHLGTAYMRLGRDEQAVDAFRKALALDPSRANTYANLAACLLRLNRIQEATVVLDDAEKRGFHTDYLLEVEYRAAVLNKDAAAIDRILRRSGEVRGSESRLLFLEANAESYLGHLEKADVLTRRAAAIAAQDGDRESAASFLAQAAIGEAEVGSVSKARALVGEAKKNANNSEITILSAVISADVGDQLLALRDCESLSKKFPQGTYVQRYWLPVIQSKVALSQGKDAAAVNLLSSSQGLGKLSVEELSLTSVYPIYVRGQAYLSAGDGKMAEAAFQKLLDEPGKTKGVLLGALAQLGRARAYLKAGRKSEARDAYRSFFDLWKGADSDLPILHEANRELSAIR